MPPDEAVEPLSPKPESSPKGEPPPILEHVVQSIAKENGLDSKQIDALRDAFKRQAQFAEEVAQGKLTPQQALERFNDLSQELKQYGIGAKTKDITIDENELAAIRTQSKGDPSEIAKGVEALYRKKTVEALDYPGPAYDRRGRLIKVAGELKLKTGDGQLVPIGPKQLEDPVIAQLAMRYNRAYVEELNHGLQSGVVRLGSEPSWSALTPEGRELDTWVRDPTNRDALRHFFTDEVVNNLQKHGAGDLFEIDPHVLFANAAKSPEALAVARGEVTNYFSRVINAVMKYSKNESFLGMDKEELGNFIRTLVRERWPDALSKE